MNSDETFFDLQVNGYGGVDLNQDHLTADQLQKMCQCLLRDGIDGILATIITDDLDKMAHRLAKIVKMRRDDPLARRIVTGFHIEGPFINHAEGFRGAHPPDAIRPADTQAMNRLLDASGGLTRLVTLAPECDEGAKVTRMLTDHGITVAAGHCDASLEQLRAAIDAGLTMFTHLGNGCPVQLHRHDNIVQRVLSLSEQLWLTFVVDGTHIPFEALGNYFRTAGLEHCIVVSDAISAAGLGPGRHKIGRLDLTIGEDMVARLPGTLQLAGATVSMAKSAANLIEYVGLSQDEALLLTATNPRRAIGWDAGPRNIDSC